MSSSTPSPDLPKVVMIDIDGTMIGKVNGVVCEYALAEAMGKKNMRAVRDTIVARLRYGIIRPHFHAFCKYADRHRSRDGWELFVYTASEARWATFLVPCIESALDIKFNRPLFTRKNCIGPECKKSVSDLLPAVYKRLKKTYRGLTHVRDLQHRVVLVDNTPTVLLPQHADVLVLCPTYAYNYVYDVLAHIDVDVVHRRFAQVASVLAAHGLYPEDAPPPTSFQEFAAIYYQRLASAMAASLDENARALAADTFWREFESAIHASTRGHHKFEARAINDRIRGRRPI